MNRLIMTNFVFVLISIFSSGCDMMTNKGGEVDKIYKDYDFEKLGYNFFAPDAKVKLHYDLEEISGLTCYKPGVLAGVQDESGRLFLINTNDGKIIRSIRFDHTGDYEGVEIIGEKAYVMESNGDLFHFEMTEGEEVKSKKENTVFNSSNDIEGLGYIDNYLLVACKASGDTKENNAKGKAIYRLDLKSLKVKKKEWLDFEVKDLSKFIEKRPYFKKVKEFDPSGIAIHPITKDIYIISADKAVIIFNKNHELVEVVKLDGKLYRQAEGICFAPDGTLYISNEGEGARGEILTLKYNK